MHPDSQNSAINGFTNGFYFVERNTYYRSILAIIDEKLSTGDPVNIGYRKKTFKQSPKVVNLQGLRYLYAFSYDHISDNYLWLYTFANRRYGVPLDDIEEIDGISVWEHLRSRAIGVIEEIKFGEFEADEIGES